MIIVDKPYVSPLLSKTIAMLNIPVLKESEVYIPAEKHLNIYNEEQFFKEYQENTPLLTNSESVLPTIHKNVYNPNMTKHIHNFKNKVLFRKSLNDLFPNFYYKEVKLKDLDSISMEDIPFPVIIKPIVGYSSSGVYRIKNAKEWIKTTQKIKQDIDYAQSVYSPDVIDGSKFIIEEWISGNEYAIDAYFNLNGEPVVLNIFKRMFSHEGDTSDRIYYTSKNVILEGLRPATEFLDKISKAYQIKNFPLHMEFRMDESEELVPIEINPLRFAGIGTTDLGYYAYGVNVYEYFFMQKRPNWEKIVQEMDDHIYSFFCAELPESKNIESVKRIDEENFKKCFLNILEYRPILSKYDKTFAVVFYESENIKENQQLIHLDLHQYIHYQDYVTY